MELELRGAATPDHFNVPPQHVLRVSRPERLHRRLFGGKPAGKMDRRYTAACTVGDLVAREDALHETLAVSLERLGDAIDVGRVDTQADDFSH